MSKYQLVTGGSPIPVPGGKTIEELFGRVHTGTQEFSVDGEEVTVAAGQSLWVEPGATVGLTLLRQESARPRRP